MAKTDYDCSTCDSDDCRGCGTEAFKAGIAEVVKFVESHYFMMQGGKLAIDSLDWEQFKEVNQSL